MVHRLFQRGTIGLKNESLEAFQAKMGLSNAFWRQATCSENVATDHFQSADLVTEIIRKIITICDSDKLHAA